ncbi:MAG TPA: DUF4169 family protein [Caulobacteraceae bacterium]
MSDLINLNRARKAKRKASAKKLAAENRVKFGRSKAVKTMDAAARAKAKTLLDQAKAEP